MEVTAEMVQHTVLQRDTGDDTTLRSGSEWLRSARYWDREDVLLEQQISIERARSNNAVVEDEQAFSDSCFLAGIEASRKEAEIDRDESDEFATAPARSHDVLPLWASRDGWEAIWNLAEKRDTLNTQMRARRIDLDLWCEVVLLEIRRSLHGM